MEKEPQNGGGLKELLDASCPPPVLAGPPTAGSSGLSRWLLNGVQGWGFYNLCHHLVPFTVKVSWCSQGAPMFHFVPVASCAVTGRRVLIVLCRFPCSYCHLVRFYFPHLIFKKTLRKLYYELYNYLQNCWAEGWMRLQNRVFFIF